jgi:hypothetical protein
MKPDSVAETIVGTLEDRPALVGAPPGLILALNLAQFVPEPLWALGRLLARADRTVGPIDRDARRDYDARIAMQAELREGPE